MNGRGSLKGGHGKRATGHHDRFRLAWEAILEFAVFDDRVLLARPFLLLLPFDFELVERLSTGYRGAVACRCGFVLWFPAAAAGGFAEETGASERICVEFAVRAAFEFGREGKVVCTATVAVETGYAGGGAE